jgi:hypothetical protein
VPFIFLPAVLLAWFRAAALIRALCCFLYNRIHHIILP